SRNRHLPGHTYQWIFRRLVAIRRWIECGALYMRIVIRAAARNVHQLDVEILQQRQETLRLGEVILFRIFNIHAEPPAIRQTAGVGFGNANRRGSSAFSSPSFSPIAIRTWTKWHNVEG